MGDVSNAEWMEGFTRASRWHTSAVAIGYVRRLVATAPNVTCGLHAQRLLEAMTNAN